MKNLILAIGTVEKQAENMFSYSLDLFAERPNENLIAIRVYEVTHAGYKEMTENVIRLVSEFYNDEAFKDGAKTIYNFQVK